MVAWSYSRREMKTTGLNLLISDKPDVERDSVAESFGRHGGVVHRIARFWEPPVLDPSSVRVYGADSFCLVLQQKLGLNLCSPDDELSSHVPSAFLKRRITRQRLGDIASFTFPSFIKPVIPKQFRGSVYPSSVELTAECRGLPADTAVFVSESVTFTAEARTFVRDGQVLDSAVYEGKEEAADAETFVAALTRVMSLPRTVVIDVGFIDGRGWGVIEFNAAWGAGLNGCDSDKVLPSIIAASEPQPGGKCSTTI
jgi:ATP-grasp domain, R2K clade family 2